jgi:hypothetical protein
MVAEHTNALVLPLSPHKKPALMGGFLADIAIFTHNDDADIYIRRRIGSGFPIPQKTVLREYSVKI